MQQHRFMGDDVAIDLEAFEEALRELRLQAQALRDQADAVDAIAETLAESIEALHGEDAAPYA